MSWGGRTKTSVPSFQHFFGTTFKLSSRGGATKKLGLWRFLAPIADFDDLWTELVLFERTGVVLVVSFHITDGGGEP